MCHVQKIAPSLRKKGNILLVLDTLVLFQMAFKTKEIALARAPPPPATALDINDLKTIF